jgi:hypothetical protein
MMAQLAEGITIDAATDEANAIGESLRPKPTSGPLSRPLPEGVRRFAVEGVKGRAATARSVIHPLRVLIVCPTSPPLLARSAGARDRGAAGGGCGADACAAVLTESGPCRHWRAFRALLGCFVSAANSPLRTQGVFQLAWADR